jgi:hypothetical protein
MDMTWQKIPPLARKRLVWVLWGITWLLLLAGLFDRNFYEYAIWFSAAHAALFLGLFAFQIKPFPVQVRIAYLLWVGVGTYVPGMTILLYITTLGLFGNLFFNYCPLARLMSLMSWNRNEQLSLDLLKRTFFSLPRTGPFSPPPAQ